MALLSKGGTSFLDYLSSSPSLRERRDQMNASTPTISHLINEPVSCEPDSIQVDGKIMMVQLLKPMYVGDRVWWMQSMDKKGDQKMKMEGTFIRRDKKDPEECHIFPDILFDEKQRLTPRILCMFRHESLLFHSQKSHSDEEKALVKNALLLKEAMEQCEEDDRKIRKHRRKSKKAMQNLQLKVGNLVRFTSRLRGVEDEVSGKVGVVTQINKFDVVVKVGANHLRVGAYVLAKIAE